MKIINTKGVLIPVVIICIISIAANFYTFNQLAAAKTENTKVNDILVEKKAETIKELGNESNNKNEITQGTDIQENDKSVNNKQKELINAATHFIEYTYNVSPENYVMLKQNASHYMTDNLIDTLFASDGLDETTSNIKTSVKSRKVFVESDATNEAIVHYTFDLEYLNNGYKETNSSYVLLKFKEIDGAIKVSELQAITDIGGV
jgi:hypothetical protein